MVVADHQGATHTRYRMYETIRPVRAEDRFDETGGPSRGPPRPACGVLRECGRIALGTNGTGPGWRDAVDWVEVELGKPAYRVPAGARSGGDMTVRHRLSRRIAGLMGFSIELFETVAWAEELLDSAAGAAVPRLPRLYTAAGYGLLRRACGRRRVPMPIAPWELESMPGYETVRTRFMRPSSRRLSEVYSGHLDRYCPS